MTEQRNHPTSQRAMIAAELATMKRGGDKKSDQSANLRNAQISQPEAAKLLNVSERSVQTDAVTRKRELGRKRSKKHRERLTLYGKPGEGYRVATCYVPADVLDLLAERYPAIAEVRDSDDKDELGRALDWLIAAAAYETLDSFQDDYEPGRLVF